MNRQSIQNYIAENKEYLYLIHRELCAIPAPSNFERERAEYCKRALESAGAEGVYIDAADNVIYPYCCEGRDSVSVFAAHLDTVFSDREPMPYYDDGVRIHSPGAADDTASVAVLLLCAMYFARYKPKAKNGILFVFNSCEEGLGNLKGVRQLFSDFADRIGRFITFDSQLDEVCDSCVGSHRYEVVAKTDGGHSWGDFGNKNAIAVLSGIVCEIYSLDLPKKDAAHTTFNVGTIFGGTSVNTIAQSASMLCEYRSSDPECLEYMRVHFDGIFDRARTEGVELQVTRVGERPCGSICPELVDELKSRVAPIIEGILGRGVKYKSGSTDCNIPMSLGIPALCVGADMYCGIHTREEWVDKQSMLTGLEIAISLGYALS